MEVKEYKFTPLRKRGLFEMSEGENKVCVNKKECTSLFKGSLFSFTNLINNKKSMYRVGNLFSIAGPKSFETYKNIRFKVNGKNAWDFLESQGVSFNFSELYNSLEYSILKDGVEIAKVKQEDINYQNPKFSFKMMFAWPSSLVKCKEENLDTIFFALFLLFYAFTSTSGSSH